MTHCIEKIINNKPISKKFGNDNHHVEMLIAKKDKKNKTNLINPIPKQEESDQQLHKQKKTLIYSMNEK